MYPYPTFPVDAAPADFLQVLVTMGLLLLIVGGIAGLSYWLSGRHDRHHHAH